MNWAKRSVSWIGCASLPAMLFVALLLLGQFVALSHSVDHDSEPSDCMVCRVSKPHEQLIEGLLLETTVNQSANDRSGRHAQLRLRTLRHTRSENAGASRFRA